MATLRNPAGHLDVDVHQQVPARRVEALLDLATAGREVELPFLLSVLHCAAQIVFLGRHRTAPTHVNCEPRRRAFASVIAASN